jgi:hypothetical protein
MKNSQLTASKIPVNSCQVFIIAFVDSSSIQSGTGQGLYFVDNRSSAGSSNEGSSALQTVCSKMSNVAWSIIPLNPNDGFQYAIQSIGSSNSWGPGGQPLPATGGYYTGQVQNAGQASYQVEINAIGGGNVFQPVTNLGMNGN